jgi:DNA-binding XRE family transcriptional regulator
MLMKKERAVALKFDDYEMTQEEVAKELDVDRTTVNNIEKRAFSKLIKELKKKRIKKEDLL